MVLSLIVISCVSLDGLAGDLVVLESGGEVESGAMMDTYLSRLTHGALDERAERCAAIRTRASFMRHQRRMRRFFDEQLGGFPERTPLNARIVGGEERDGFRFEKIIYESRPGFFVTALLFLPLSAPPYPGVLVPCGHSMNGKACEPYQRACMFLARSDIAALCYDPIGQGERHQILDSDGKPRFGPTLEHTLTGVGCIMLGANAATYRIWDGIRSIDYLASRVDIIPERIGCTGNSGGGTLTSYIMALDPRVQCAAPSCYLTSLRRLVDTAGMQDAEQNIAGQIARGMDHADYILMRAPKPTLICAAKQDFFDICGTRETFEEARRFYGLLDYPERLAMVEADARHGFSATLRAGMVAWMRRWLLDTEEPVEEAEIPILTDAEAQCAPGGEVLLMEGARSVFDINADLERRWSATRQNLWSTPGRRRALGKVRKVAGIRPLRCLPKLECEAAGSVSRGSYRIDKLLLRPEPGIILPALMFSRPGVPDNKVCLYLHGEGKHVDGRPGGPIERLVRAGYCVLAVDLRGIGETESTRGTGDWAAYCGADWQDFFQAYVLGKSYVGMRAEDILVCARYLRHRAPTMDGVHLVAIGEAAVPALHAAALEPDLFTSARLEQCITSWADVVRTPITRNQLINTIHGVLRVYDLPDLIACLPPGKVQIGSPAPRGTGDVSS